MKSFSVVVSSLIRLSSNVRTPLCKLERPSFLVGENNRPTHAYLTLGTGPASYAQLERSIIITFPLG